MALTFPPAAHPSIIAVHPWLLHLIRSILDARQTYPLQATSWYRDREENWRVEGDEYSQHRIGLAVDLIPADPALAAVLRRQGLVVVNERDHLHVQAWPKGLLRQIAGYGFLLP